MKAIDTLWTVARKEFRDSIRDKRTLMAAAAFAVFGPLLIAGMITITAERETSSGPYPVAVEGAEYATDLVDYLARHDADFDSEETPRVTLTVPSDYAERFQSGETVRLVVAADRSKNNARRDAQRLERTLQRYGAELGQLRLMVRGLAGSVVRPIEIDSRDLATPEARASLVLGILVIYFLLAAFIGSLAVSIDVSAGERERNSLEVLMAQPVSPYAVFAGKTAVAGLFGLVGIAATFVAAKLAFVKVPLSKLGLSWTLDWWSAAEMVAGLIPLAAMVAALQIALAMWAKTYKEASSYLNMLSFLPAVMSVVVLVQEIEPEAWMYGVPLLGHQQMLRTMIRGEPVEATMMTLLAVSTLALTAVLIWAGGRMLTRERIIFGQTD